MALVDLLLGSCPPDVLCCCVLVEEVDAACSNAEGSWRPNRNMAKGLLAKPDVLLLLGACLLHRASNMFICVRLTAPLENDVIRLRVPSWQVDVFGDLLPAVTRLQNP